MKKDISEDQQLVSLEKTQIYKDIRLLLMDTNRIQANLSKKFKYTLGNRIADSVIELSQMVFSGFIEKDPYLKKEILNKAIKYISTVLVLYRIVNDLESTLSQNQYVNQISNIMKISTQLRSWEASINI